MSIIKLSGFAKSVLGDAKAQKKQLLDEIAGQKQAQVQNIEMDILKKMYDEIKVETESIKSDVAAEINTADREARLKLIGKRQEISDRVFASLRERIAAFIKTNEYKTYFSRKLLGILSGIKTSAVIYVSTDDGETARTVVSALPDGAERFTVDVDTGIVLGGFTVLTDSGTIKYDERVEKLLEDRREMFAEISGLTIDN